MQPGFFSDRTSKISGAVDVFVQWTSGATGAVPALSTFKYSSFVKSVTRNGVGDFTIVFDDACVGLMEYNGSVAQASFALSGACQVLLKANSVAVVGTNSIRIQVTTGPGVAVDPTTNDVVILALTLQQNDVNG